MCIQVLNVCLKQFSKVKWVFWHTMAAVTSSGWMRDMLVAIEEISPGLSIKRAQKKKHIQLGLMLAFFQHKSGKCKTRQSATFCLNQPLYAVMSHTINLTRAKARSLSHQIAFCTVAALIMLNREVPGGALHVFTGYSGIREALLQLSNSRHDSHTSPLYCYKCTT